MSLDDVYNHLKFYEPEVQMRAGSNLHNIAFISSSNTSSRKSKVPTVQGVSTASAQVSTNNTNVAAASLSYHHQGVKTEERKRESYKKDPKVEEPAPKEMIAIDDIGWDWSYMAEEDESSKNHALYCAVPPPPAQVYSPPKKDLSWIGLPEFVDDTVIDYARPTPSIDESTSPMIKFVKESGCPNATKVNNTENAKKPTVKYAEIPKIPTVGLKVPTAKPTVVADKGNKGKAVKASARWIWKPKQNSSGQGLNFNGVSGIPQDNIDDKVYWNNGCSRHMTGNISYLFEYEPFNGGYVSFGHGRGKITGKGSIKIDESMLWQRRLGHLNFKTMNKLVRSNLVKDLPFKSFENDHSCVACLKGKQHKAS
nr:ribonuclease H-like domain-containing protein [Tanacetum cinerariifolium]